MMPPEQTGFKVFHFGCTDDYRGKWIQAGSVPGFHIWRTYEQALAYQKRIQGGEIMPVKYRNELNTIMEPDGLAICAEWIYVP